MHKALRAHTQTCSLVGMTFPTAWGLSSSAHRLGLVSQVAALMASTLGVDMVMTGHSLGRNKLEHLLASGAPWARAAEEWQWTHPAAQRLPSMHSGCISM